jgi:N-glycosylase/DNA lyase
MQGQSLKIQSVSLASRIRFLMTESVAPKIEDRINEFKVLHLKPNEYWFSEMCFCILTANSSARLGMKIQETLGTEGFLNLSEQEILGCLKKFGHRFGEKRANFIAKARDFRKIKDKIMEIGDEGKAREWLAENVMGLGYKEASHFLRNVGYDDIAILDRHVLRIMTDYKLIREVPKTLTRRRYLELEGILRTLAMEVNMPLSKLDLYIWYMKTGTVLK